MKIRIVNPKRFARVILGAVFIGWLLSFAHEWATDDFVVVGQIKVRAERGDSVWALIQEHNRKEVLANGDLREVLDYFKEVNGTQSTSLQEGDVVFIPVVKLK